MRIVHVIPALTKGGAERVVVDLANAAVEDGHEVSIVAAIPAPPELVAQDLRPEVDIRYVGSGSIRAAYLRLPLWLVRNRKWLFGQDVIHCHLTFGSVFAAAAQRLRRLLRRRPAIVETYHAVGMAIPNSERARHAMLLKGRDAIAFMAEDSFWRRYAMGNKSTIFRTIPNGIAEPRPASKEKSRRYRTHCAAIPENALAVVGTVGRLVPARRPDLLLEAFANVAEAIGPDVHLLMAGEGGERGALEETARRKGIARQVHMPGLVLDPAEPIGAMDLYLTINVGPITGIAGLEAAFLGVPVIGLQILDDYESKADDWIWSSRNPGEVALTAVDLLNDRAALHDLAERQQAIARQRFSIDAMSRAYDELYSVALARRA